MTNNEPLFSLQDADLSNLLMPSWMKEEDRQKSPSASSSYTEFKTPAERFTKNPFQKRGSQKNDRRDHSSRGSENGRSRGTSQKPSFSQRERSPRPLPPKLMQGWKLFFFPGERIVEEFVKRVKAENKAYPLFELARLILEKPERYRVEFARSADAAVPVSKLYQCLPDESLWLSENEAVAQAFKSARNRYYSSEKITTEPPKGSYNSVAVCGMSQTILGPSSHHEYQAKVRQLHAEKFSHLPFEQFKSRIQIVRDAEVIEKWKEEQCVREEFSSVEKEEGSEPKKFATLAEVEAHFKKEYAAALITEIENEVTLPGAALRTSSELVVDAAQTALDELRRFPLPLSHLLGQKFTAHGLQVFKAKENIVYVSIARPRILNRSETPLSANLIALLDTLEAHHQSPRAEQWHALVGSRSLLEGSTEAERESAVAKDLAWLIHEGYVINYALRGFEVTKI
jgi:hypothetical protein